MVTDSAICNEPCSSWNSSRRRSRVGIGFWPAMARTGTESRYACPSAVITLVSPGPGTTMQAAGRPVARAKPSAMKPAPPSWRVVTTRRSSRSVRPSKISELWVPTIPKTVSIPSAFKARATA